MYLTFKKKWDKTLRKKSLYDIIFCLQEWIDEKKLEDLPSSELVFDLMDQSNPDMGEIPGKANVTGCRLFKKNLHWHLKFY